MIADKKFRRGFLKTVFSTLSSAVILKEAKGLTDPQPMRDKKSLAGVVENTYSSLAALKAVDVTQVSYNLVRTSIDGTFNYETANAPYTADDVNVIKLDGTSLSIGALVRQKSSSLSTIAAGSTIRRKQSEKNDDVVNVLDFIPVSEHADIIGGSSTYDATSDVQDAIDSVIGTQGATLVVRGRIRIDSSLMIDRPVDGTLGEFVMLGIGDGAGFHTTGAVTMFSSTIAHTTGPVSEAVTFNNILFTCDSNDTAAYTVSEKFLRVTFTNCRWDKIKCNDSLIYMQSWRWFGGSVWRWKGSFSKTAQQAYDCHSIGLRFEGASVGGDAFDWDFPHGCSVNGGTYEGALGSHIRATSTNGFDVSGNYTENANATNPDYVFAAQSSGGLGKGVNFTGNHINTSNADSTSYPVILGKTKGFGGGNYSNRNLYDDTYVRTGDFSSIGDSAGGTLNKSGLPIKVLPSGVKTVTNDITAHAGGGQAHAVLLASQINVVSTVAKTGDSIVLPEPSSDSTLAFEVYVLNNGANTLDIFPPVGCQFAFTPVNEAKTLAGGGKSKIYRYLGSGVYSQA